MPWGAEFFINKMVRELKIEQILDKTEKGEEYATLARVETGGFAIICKLQNNVKVCFQASRDIALEIYLHSAYEVIGGQGMLWIN